MQFETSSNGSFQIIKLRKDIEAEIESLKMARRQLEFHIDRTEIWAENVGRWNAHIYNSEVRPSSRNSTAHFMSDVARWNSTQYSSKLCVQIVKEGDRMVAYFVIVVHLPGAAPIQPQGNTGFTQGWVISRQLADFRALHQQVKQVKHEAHRAFPREKLLLSVDANNAENVCFASDMIFVTQFYLALCCECVNMKRKQVFFFG